MPRKIVTAIASHWETWAGNCSSLNSVVLWLTAIGVLISFYHFMRYFYLIFLSLYEKSHLSLQNVYEVIFCFSVHSWHSLKKTFLEFSIFCHHCFSHKRTSSLISLTYILDSGTARTSLSYGRSKSWHCWPLGTEVSNRQGKKEYYISTVVWFQVY